MIHCGKLLQPGGLALMDELLALIATGVARIGSQLIEYLLCNLPGITANADRDFLGEPDAVGLMST